MEISTLMLILILVVAVLFSFLCGILTERRLSKNPKINYQPKSGSNCRVVEPEFIVTNAEYSGTDDFCQPVGIYAFNGSEMLYLCPDQALGERASVTYTDDLFFIHGSGGAATGSIIVYRIAPDGCSTERRSA